MADARQDLLRGTLEMLILKSLELGPMHGWGVGERIQALSDDVFRVNTGSLYPALNRLMTKGWIAAEWRASDNNRRARYYDLTSAGRRRLGVERAQWEQAFAAVNRILEAAPAGA